MFQCRWLMVVPRMPRRFYQCTCLGHISVVSNFDCLWTSVHSSSGVVETRPAFVLRWLKRHRASRGIACYSDADDRSSTYPTIRCMAELTLVSQWTLGFYSPEMSSIPRSFAPDRSTMRASYSLSFPMSFSSVSASLGRGLLKFVFSIRAKS